MKDATGGVNKAGKAFYRPEDPAGQEYRTALNDPGEYPFTCGVRRHPASANT
jgi:hypothetical protein